MQDIDLTERPRSRGDLAAWYAAALEDQAASGLSLPGYADELGVTATTLYQWKRRLSAEDGGEFETSRSLGLVEVSLDDRERAGDSVPFVVRLGHDRCVEVPRRFDDQDLIRLVGILESC